MRGAISGHHGSPTTSNQRFLPFECVPRGNGHRAVVGISPSCESLWSTLGTTLRAHVGSVVCAVPHVVFDNTWVA